MLLAAAKASVPAVSAARGWQSVDPADRSVSGSPSSHTSTPVGFWRAAPLADARGVAAREGGGQRHAPGGRGELLRTAGQDVPGAWGRDGRPRHPRFGRRGSHGAGPQGCVRSRRFLFRVSRRLEGVHRPQEIAAVGATCGLSPWLPGAWACPGAELAMLWPQTPRADVRALLLGLWIRVSCWQKGWPSRTGRLRVGWRRLHRGARAGCCATGAHEDLRRRQPPGRLRSRHRWTTEAAAGTLHVRAAVSCLIVLRGGGCYAQADE